MRIPLEHQLLAGDIFLESEWPESGNFGSRRAQIPCLAEPPLDVRLEKQVFRKHGHAVEEPITRRVALRKLNDDRVRILFANRNRLAAHDEKVALRRLDRFIEMHLKCKQN